MTTPTSRIEWLMESAWIAVLAELAGDTVSVARWGDQSREDSYPCILVHCAGSECPDSDTGFDYPVVTFLAFTRAYPDEDETGEDLADLIGLVRDTARREQVESLLTQAQEGLTVFYVGATSSDFPPLDDSDRKIRQASVSIEHKATCYEFPEPEE